MDPNTALDQLGYLYDDVVEAGFAHRDQIFAIQEYTDSLVEWINGGGFLPAFVSEPQPWQTDPGRWSAWIAWVYPQLDLITRARLDAPDGILG